MRVYNSYGSKNRLFELVQKVNNINISEGNEDILDFLKIVRSDYPDNNDIYVKFLNLAKKKGVESAKSEYESNYSPLALKNRAKIDRQHQKTIDNLEKHNQLASRYSGVIQLIQTLIKQHGLYDLILSLINKEHASKSLVNLIANKKYSNDFNRVINDMAGFDKKFLRHPRNLIPLESIELRETKPLKWEKNTVDKYGLSLKISTYVSAGAFTGSEIDTEDFIYYNVLLDPDLDSHIFNTAILSKTNGRNYGAEYKFKRLESLASRYNKRMLTPEQFAEFFSEFIDVYDKPDNFYQQKVLSKLNETVLPKERKEEIIKDFVQYACNELQIKNPPVVTISYDDKEASQMLSFGKFTPDDNKIRVVIVNRNLADILRTLAHEIVHYKQNLNGKLTPDSNTTGSPDENEANTVAGILLRNYGKNNPIIFE